MTQTKANFEPGKEREYRLFIIWLNLPPNIIAMSEQELEDEGLDDIDLKVLAGIKTQKEFAKKFKVMESTLTQWKKEEVPEEFKQYDWKYWAKKLTKNVVRYLYEGVKEEKDAARTKLWLQAVDGFEEKTQVKHDTNTETLKALRDLANTLNGLNQDTQGSISGHPTQPE